MNQSQFGYHIDYVNYCNYLKDDFDITYLCWDYKNKKNEEYNIKIIYVSREGNIIQRNFRFIKYILKILNQNNFTLTFIHYFRGVSIVSLLNKNNNPLHLDIRTGSVSKNIVNRVLYNSTLRFESHFFKSISIISNGLRHKLGVDRKAYILPLGANPISVNRQNKHQIHLLYVGTLHNRRIEDTIEGMKLFLERIPNANIHYTIIGKGWHKEEEILLKFVNQLKLQKHIELIGYVANNELQPYYEKANVGVSYIPMTPYYEFQPATKTFEYLMAGMPVIATKTYENKQVVNQQNGVLIKDTPESFAKGIEQMFNQHSFFIENTIRQSVEGYEWSKIIQNMKRALLS